MMKISIKATKIDLSEEIKDFLNNQLKLLEKFVKKFLEKKETEMSVWVEVGKATMHHKKGPIFYAECQMNFGGRSIRSEVLQENLKSAIVEMREELEREIKKEKEKRIVKAKEGARIAKRELKISEFAKKDKKRVLLRENK